MAVTKAPSSVDALKLADPLKSAAPAKENKKEGSPAPDPVILAYMMIADSVLINNRTAELESKQLQINAAVQNNLINQEQGFSLICVASDAGLKRFLDGHIGQFQNSLTCKAVLSWEIMSSKGGVLAFSTVPLSGNMSGKMDVLDKVEEENQSINATRGLFEDKLNMEMQNAQMQEAGLNTSANNSANAMQEGGSLMQMLTALTNQISQI